MLRITDYHLCGALKHAFCFATVDEGGDEMSATGKQVKWQLKELWLEIDRFVYSSILINQLTFPLDFLVVYCFCISLNISILSEGVTLNQTQTCLAAGQDFINLN